ncbi:spermatogenesis-defective protein 39 homolog isoform X2 [Xenia sp. Carnegie-2017]|uniref:spermatogenesis-defective protein 39 homolog isoform X2 n=1 Tax=Xenia sp. Carnegie-2017 TaxID=2897299 RepID=UPI001F040524|nr:spermatogenesis-defective protein 39 homolog isoform X2 [Xenia sp. Carnegie-2017]
MALNGMSSDSVHFTKEKPRVKKNFFDDEEEEDFEKFDNDEDFIKMRVSEPDEEEYEDEKEELGEPWEKVNAPATTTILSSSNVKANSTFAQHKNQSDTFSPSFVSDNLQSHAQYSKATHFSKTTTYSTVEQFRNQTHKLSNENTTSIESVIEKGNSEMAEEKINRLEMEKRELQKTVQSLRKLNRKSPLPEETVKKLMMNEPCALEIHRSLEEKLALLDVAIQLGDGDVLTRILLFFKKTIKPNIFVREIKRRPVAANHIVTFLKSHFDHDEVIKLLRILNRKEEAMMLEYKIALSSSSHVDSQIQAIVTCQRMNEISPELTDVVAILKQHESLLKRQVQIEIKDKRTQVEGKNEIMRLHPLKPVTSSPLMTTLRHCCFYHFGKDDNILGPVSLQKEFKLTDKQFEWTMVAARAELKKWADLDMLFTSKSWYGSNKQKSSLGFHKVVGILEKSNAPRDIIGKYLNLVDDLELRLTLSTRLKCHKIAVETIVSMKDRQRLEEYRKQVERTNPVQSLISNYLQNSQIKWR